MINNALAMVGLGRQAATTGLKGAEMSFEMGKRSYGIGAIIGAALVGAIMGGLVALAFASMAKAEKGANFITDGPMPLMVGDNPGGKEHVQVTPIGSENQSGPGGGVNEGALMMAFKEGFEYLGNEIKLNTATTAANKEDVFYNRGQNLGNIALGSLKFGNVGDTNQFN